MVKDAVNNDLLEGDHVVVGAAALPPHFIAKIIKISEGGLAVPTGKGGQQAIAGGTLQLQMDFALMFNPTQNINVVKVVTPVKISSAN